MIPDDPRKPSETSGVRIGTPAVTTRGMGEAEMAVIGRCIVDVIGNLRDPAAIRNDVRGLTERFRDFLEA